MDQNETTYFLNMLDEKELEYYQYIINIQNGDDEDIQLVYKLLKFDILVSKLINFIYKFYINKNYLYYHICTSFNFIEQIPDLEEIVFIYKNIDVINNDCINTIAKMTKSYKHNLNTNQNDLLAQIYLYVTILTSLNTKRFNYCLNHFDIFQSKCNGYSLQIPEYNIEQNSNDVDKIYQYIKKIKN